VFILSEFYVIRANRNTRGIAGAIFSFHVNQNSMLSKFVLTGLHCTYYIASVFEYVCMYAYTYTNQGFRNAHTSEGRKVPNGAGVQQQHTGHMYVYLPQLAKSEGGRPPCPLVPTPM
jgi:hypothetical protein